MGDEDVPPQTPGAQDHDYDTFPADTCARTYPFVKKGERIAQLEKSVLEKDLLIKELQETILKLNAEKSRRFSVDDVKSSTKHVRLYTGLQNIGVFNWLFDRIKEKAKCLTYLNGQKTGLSKVKKVTKKRGRKRKLPLKDEFFLTLCRVRAGLTEDDLSFRFGISQGTVSKILSTWIPFLGREMKCLIHWPSRENNNRVYPKCFKKFPNVIGIIDCTEGAIEKPSLAKAQAQTYSTYNSENTWKTLISVTPGGTISFISRSYGGLASDRHITETSGILDHLNPGDSLMADKGFNISDLLVGNCCKLVIPPFLRNKGRFSKRNSKKTSKVVKARIHVERAIARIKDFRILQGAIPISLKDILDDIFTICCAITNLAPPLVPL